MCGIEFQRKSLETFFVYEVVIDAVNADLGAIGSPEPVRSVSVNHVAYILTV